MSLCSFVRARAVVVIALLVILFPNDGRHVQAQGCAVFNTDGTCAATCVTYNSDGTCAETQPVSNDDNSRKTQSKKKKKKKKKKRRQEEVVEVVVEQNTADVSFGGGGDTLLNGGDGDEEFDTAYEVTGSDLDTINGVYIRTDEWNGQPLYTNQGLTAVMYFRDTLGAAGTWYVRTND